MSLAESFCPDDLSRPAASTVGASVSRFKSSRFSPYQTPGAVHERRITQLEEDVKMLGAGLGAGAGLETRIQQLEEDIKMLGAGLGGAGFVSVEEFEELKKTIVLLLGSAPAANFVTKDEFQQEIKNQGATDSRMLTDIADLQEELGKAQIRIDKLEKEVWALTFKK